MMVANYFSKKGIVWVHFSNIHIYDQIRDMETNQKKKNTFKVVGCNGILYP